MIYDNAFVHNHDEFVFSSEGGPIYLEDLPQGVTYGAAITENVWIVQNTINQDLVTGTAGQPAGNWGCTIPGSGTYVTDGIEAHSNYNLNILGNTIYNTTGTAVYVSNSAGPVSVSTFWNQPSNQCQGWGTPCFSNQGSSFYDACPDSSSPSSQCSQTDIGPSTFNGVWISGDNNNQSYRDQFGVVQPALPASITFDGLIATQDSSNAVSLDPSANPVGGGGGYTVQFLHNACLVGGGWANLCRAVGLRDDCRQCDRVPGEHIHVSSVLSVATSPENQFRRHKEKNRCKHQCL